MERGRRPGRGAHVHGHPPQALPLPHLPQHYIRQAGFSAAPPRHQAPTEELGPPRPAAVPGVWSPHKLLTQSLETQGPASQTSCIPMPQMPTPFLEPPAPGTPQVLLPGAECHRRREPDLGTGEDEVPVDVIVFSRAVGQRSLADPADSAVSGAVREINSCD